jgi:hypothetical protein
MLSKADNVATMDESSTKEHLVISKEATGIVPAEVKKKLIGMGINV